MSKYLKDNKETLKKNSGEKYRSSSEEEKVKMQQYEHEQYKNFSEDEK